MTESFKKALLAIVNSLICWFLIDQFLIDVSLWKYLVIELIFTIFRKIYDLQLKQLGYATKRKR